jgi:hypothetical protein
MTTTTPDRAPTLAEKLADEADVQRELGTPYNLLLGRLFADMAARAEREGLTSEAEYLAKYPTGV